MSDLPVAKKSLGQHWLNDPGALQAICDAGDITSDDVVLEIGPGTGTLTQLLVQKAKEVVAVEFDRELATALERHFRQSNFRVVQQDILSFDLTGLPTDYKVVANIPYYLTSKLIRVLSETPNRASRVVLLIQKEVAERITAKPGNMSLLAASAQFYWKVKLDREVPAKLFTPSPKVDSQVIILERRNQPLFSDVDEKAFFRLIKAGFSARRKKLRSSLSGGLRISKQEAETLLINGKIDPNLRAQALSLNEWHQLYQTSQTAD